MARNKYPEVTVKHILDVSQRLFLEKGYDNTTIQDIVDALNGLTKGAVYHHFKSKEEIINAIGDRLFFENNPFAAVRDRSDLNGLQKLREVIRLNHADPARRSITVQTIPLTKNPRILAGMIDSNRRILTPYFLELIEEGNRDGSICTKYSREIAELLPLLTNLWLSPSVFPVTKEEAKQKFLFLQTMLSQMGVPLIDDTLLTLLCNLLSQLPDTK